MIASRSKAGLLAADAAAAAPSALEQEVAALFDELRVPVLRYLHTFGLSSHDAEEIAQEVFLALFQHLRRGKPRTNLQAWIFRVAHNLGLKRCQSLRRVTPEPPDAAAHPDPEPNPEQQAAASQRQQRLLAVVDALPELDRRCLYLRAEGLRYREIKEVLGISLGAVALSLERSLGRLTRVSAR